MTRCCENREREHYERVVPVPAVPGAGFVVVEAEFVLRRLEGVLIAQRRPPTATSVLISAPAGHQVVKWASSPSAT